MLSAYQKFKNNQDSLLPYFFAVFCIFCLLGFNLLGVARFAWFETFQMDSEGLVLGRMIQSMQDGFLSHGGILTNHDAGFWNPYESAIGLQGILFDTLNQILPLSFESVVDLFHVMTALFTSVVLVALFMWFRVEVGATAFVLLATGLFFSPWLVVYGPNLYWVFGTLYLPMLLLAWKGVSLQRENKENTRRVMLYYFLLFFVKCACGYEYLSTIVIASWTPLFFYAYRDQWKIARLVKIMFMTGALSVLAFALAAVINAYQLSLANESSYVDAGIEILKRWDTRMGMPVPVTDTFVDSPESLSADRLPVIGMYMRGLIDGPAISLSVFHWPPTFGMLALVAGCLSVFATIASRYIACFKEHARTLNALSLAMWAGFGGMLSWFVIAKQHAFVHHHTNFVLWYLPFAFYFLALVGKVATVILRQRN